MSNILKSEKPHMKIILNLCKDNMKTVTGRNLNLLKSKYNCDSINDLISMKGDIKHQRVHALSEDEQWKIPLIEELCLVKNNNLDLDFDEKFIDSTLKMTSLLTKLLKISF